MRADIISFKKLEQICASPQWRHVLHPCLYIDGVLFAVSAAPEIPMPEVWLPWVVKNQGGIQQKHIDQLMGVLLERLKSRLSSMRDERFYLPERCQFEAQSSNQDLTDWLTGLLVGHQQLESVWQDAWQHMLKGAPEEQAALRRDLSHCLRMFSTFADPTLAIQQAKETGNLSLEGKLAQIFLSFPKALQQYVDISGKLVSYLPNQFELYQEPIAPVATPKKPGKK
ncbi:UPF0149 family protein [Alteromonas sp. a30]|uniref:UPF0149 family protein n=1 Tax=Alteromonas sp. a30 TaxID=2730917 RepID=UPI002DDCEF74|nr:UPF0149 family protein [Alteromonas sp. a30]MCY7295327.1 UPF0149 family protein [Alteromonas sp. a30]